MSLAPIDALCSLTDDTLRALREALRAQGFTPEVIADGEGIAPAMLDALRLPLVLDALRETSTPARELARLFVYYDALDPLRARALLGDEVVSALLAAGALTEHPEGLRAAVLLTPFFDLLLLSDPLHSFADAVMGPGPTTLTLAEAIPSSPGTVLDVGCGAGTLALLALTRGASQAVGVDISSRAVALAALNARLNGLDARFVQSDLTGAVRGERFDLVVSQPAFIAQPPDVAASTFAHGGARGEELAMRLLGEIPAVLAERGSALVLLQSAMPSSPPLPQRVRAALSASRVSVVVAASARTPVEVYCIGYAALRSPALDEQWREAALRYRAHLRRSGIEGFEHALLCLDADGLGYTAVLTLNELRGFNADALHALRRALSLAAQRDEALLDARVCAARGVTWVEERPRPDSSLEPRWVARFRAPAFADRELSEASWVLLGMLDGAPRVRDAVASYAEVCGATPSEVSAQVLGFVRENLARGLLERAP